MGGGGGIQSKNTIRDKRVDHNSSELLVISMAEDKTSALVVLRRMQGCRRDKSYTQVLVLTTYQKLELV